MGLVGPRSNVSRAVFFSRLWERILFLAFSSLESLPAFYWPAGPTTFMRSNG